MANVPAFRQYSEADYASVVLFLRFRVAPHPV